MTRIVILSAPQGTGKGRHARALARALSCTMIIEDYDGSQKLYPGALALTHLDPDELNIPHTAEIFRDCLQVLALDYRPTTEVHVLLGVPGTAFEQLAHDWCVRDHSRRAA